MYVLLLFYCYFVYVVGTVSLSFPDIIESLTIGLSLLWPGDEGVRTYSVYVVIRVSMSSGQACGLTIYYHFATWSIWTHAAFLAYPAPESHSLLSHYWLTLNIRHSGLLLIAHMHLQIWRDEKLCICPASVTLLFDIVMTKGFWTNRVLSQLPVSWGTTELLSTYATHWQTPDCHSHIIIIHGAFHFMLKTLKVGKCTVIPYIMCWIIIAYNTLWLAGKTK